MHSFCASVTCSFSLFSRETIRLTFSFLFSACLLLLHLEHSAREFTSGMPRLEVNEQPSSTCGTIFISTSHHKKVQVKSTRVKVYSFSFLRLHWRVQSLFLTRRSHFVGPFSFSLVLLMKHWCNYHTCLSSVNIIVPAWFFLPWNCIWMVTWNNLHWTVECKATCEAAYICTSEIFATFTLRRKGERELVKLLQL